MAKILLIDDDESIAWVVRKTLEADHEVVHAATGAGGLELFGEAPSLVLLDLRLPDASGLDILKTLLGKQPGIPVVMVTAHGGMESAVEAMKLGAYDYLEKPFDLDELRIVVRRALEDTAMRTELVRLRARVADEAPLIVGSSPGMLSVFKAIGRIAPRPVTVLILGESGTGKDLVARAIHHNSPRTGKPYVVINSASVPRDLLEAELFGVKKGAFTGADKDRHGKVAAADGGTLFLDEIGEMALETQAKLLRVIEDKMITPLGDTQPVSVDVRLIAATNRDLEKDVEAGRFREDLFYRLNVFSIQLPPLRERREDIPVLAQHFLKRAEEQLGTGPKAFSDGCLEYLSEQNWAGNVRELENAIKRVALVSSGPIIEKGDLRLTLKGKKELTLDAFFADRLRGLLGEISKMDQFNLYDTVIKEVDRALLKLVLSHTKGNQLAASRILGINRNTLRKKMTELKMKGKGA